MFDDLIRIINSGRMHGYQGDYPPVEPQRPGFIEFEHREGPYVYRDSYAGFLQFLGEEVVWREKDGLLLPVWSMVYKGGMVMQFGSNRKYSESVYRFLKSALRQGVSGAFAPRGPAKSGDSFIVYETQWEGDVVSFKGEELIRDRSDVVYTCSFAGGLIINDPV